MAVPARFIHTSDWQLGMTRAFLSDEAAARFSQARIDAISTLGTLATHHDARFIVVAGDVFESNQLSRQVLLRTLDALQALPVPVFLLPGNHDPLDGSSIFSSSLFADVPPHVMVLKNMQPVPVPGVEGVEVVGAPWRSKRPLSDLCADLGTSLEAAGDNTRIAVCHGQVDTLSPDPSRPEIIQLKAAEQFIEEGRFQYLALGDRHSVTAVGTTGRIWYSGAPVATAFDEQQPNHALLVDVNSQGEVNTTALETGHWHFIAAEREINSDEDVHQFNRWLESLPTKETTIIKVAFQGSVSLATRARLDETMATQGALFASLRQRDRTSDLVVVPDELDRSSVALSGYALKAWQELVDLSRQPERDEGQQRTAQDALRLFYRLGAEHE